MPTVLHENSEQAGRLHRNFFPVHIVIYHGISEVPIVNYSSHNAVHACMELLSVFAHPVWSRCAR